MSKIALVYWPKGGSVEKVSNLFSEKLKDHELLFSDISEVDINQLMKTANQKKLMKDLTNGSNK